MPCEEAGEAAAKLLAGLVLLCVAYNAVVMLCRPAEAPPPRSRSRAAHARRRSSLKTAGGGGGSSVRPHRTVKRLSISEGPKAPAAGAKGPEGAQAPEKHPRQRSPVMAVASKVAEDGGRRSSLRAAPSPKRPPPAPPPTPLPPKLYVMGAEEKAQAKGKEKEKGKDEGKPALLLLRARSPPAAEPGAPGAQLYEAQWVRGDPEAHGKKEGRSARFRKQP